MVDVVEGAPGAGRLSSPPPQSSESPSHSTPRSDRPPSRFADHRDVAIPNSPTQPLALARFNMPSRLGEGNIIAWWAHTYAVAIADRGTTTGRTWRVRRVGTLT